MIVVVVVLHPLLNVVRVSEEGRPRIGVAQHKRRISSHVVVVQGVGFSHCLLGESLLWNRLVFEENGIAGVFAALGGREALILKLCRQWFGRVDVNDLLAIVVYAH